MTGTDPLARKRAPGASISSVTRCSVSMSDLGAPDDMAQGWGGHSRC